MIKLKNSLIFFIFLITFSVLQAQSFNVATYNIKNDIGDYDAKHGNGWKQRYPYLCDLINYHQFDIFGTQEGLTHQLEDMLERLPQYSYIGVGRDDGKKGGEYSAIFYNKEKFKLLDSGYFWISEDMTKPNLGWDAEYIRVCSWGKFKELANNKDFYFFNIHTDNVGVKARYEGAKLILNQIKEITDNDPTILTGDFNVNQNDESYKLLNNSGILRDAYTLSPVKYENNGTFNDFNTNEWNNERIDHIFLTKDFKVSNYAILTDMYWQKLDVTNKTVVRIPSDHYPVVVSVELKK